MPHARCYALIVSTLLVCQTVAAQVIVRDLGDFSLKLGTTPSRSMAQGLVTPTSGGSTFHGGLDLTHDSGFYVGQWSPHAGIAPQSSLEVDSYMGFKKPFDKTLGYELGVIRYSYPNTDQIDSHELYAGFQVFDSRIGTAFSNDAGRQDSTLFLDLGGIAPLGVDLRMQYGNHQLDTPTLIEDGGMVSTYKDWSFNVSRPLMGMNMNLVYSGSSLTGANCSAYSGHNSECETTVTLKVVRSFF
ncbi:TorF family putative porin [Pseudomonas sp. 10B1]|uniref:TorF family putative porin n=1 Tax=unclassified Pseudomonas TaxID=196821 RepID=UPI002AB4E907|nr:MULTISPECIES: TorF family putative porin [unclassified Pseudomonas]MDY7559826.1 TorF family putative porin [Pseudomonas sp. AB6]MEA9976579.1 TorF family putative porin [Pseudomonas sp. RTS4]MEA9992937.1 TorF family putative porin [Pseudomonas sp. AA4]MEB0089112.1 TorF family putative porin [Pseudomonas sp. RTI1]MEB0125685.1 TorF family putative porin [Pseudomonas sp. CCC1.2]